MRINFNIIVIFLEVILIGIFICVWMEILDLSQAQEKNHNTRYEVMQKIIDKAEHRKNAIEDNKNIQNFNMVITQNEQDTNFFQNILNVLIAIFVVGNIFVYLMLSRQRCLLKKKDKEFDELKYALDSHSIVYITDTEGMITLVNDKFMEVSGYSRDELIGENYRLLKSCLHKDGFWQKIEETLNAGNTWHGEMCNISKNNEEYWLGASIVPFRGHNNKTMSYITIASNITKRRKIEAKLITSMKEVEASAIAKSEFLASMSHEIRTPLNAILGFVTILKKMIKEDKAKGYLDIIDTSGKSLLTIINDILDFSKMQSGQFTIDKHPVKSIDEFTKSLMLFVSKAYEKHLSYCVYIDPKLPKTISVDSVRVQQIMSNLLSNAMKFTPLYGEVNVCVRHDGENLIVSVQDSGIGIAPQNIKKIFSAFSQADGSTTRKYGGTGLGLSISSTLASLMQGELSVTSIEGEGSTFTLCIPSVIIEKDPLALLEIDSFSKLRFAILNISEASMSSTVLIKKYLHAFGIENVLELESYQADGYDILFFIPDEDYNQEIIDATIPAIAMLRTNLITLADFEHIVPLYAPFTPKSIVEAINDTCVDDIKMIEVQTKEEDSDEEIQFCGNILVVEDNKTNQMLIKLILMDYGIDFKVANDGVEGVAMFKDGKFDMVLMDENMPNKNGIEAMLEIKAYEKEKSLIMTPVVALTANALEADRARFKELGMDGFVAKPIDNEALEVELTKYLRVVG
ncbi:response regulator [Sulfurimonas sp. SAG-AH-194-I05]|nr:ATP-binding protein [Sulfurimonas sp. SAG-AH-194-I05]MDF1875380.1 response regulator [Sulfurimonas sp. SAG-AH-194-I05]